MFNIPSYAEGFDDGFDDAEDRLTFRIRTYSFDEKEQADYQRGYIAGYDACGNNTFPCQMVG